MLEQIVQAACRVFEVTPAQLVDPRDHRQRVARAVVFHLAQHHTEPVRQVDLAARFNVSTSTVRDVLLWLPARLESPQHNVAWSLAKVMETVADATEGKAGG